MADTVTPERMQEIRERLANIQPVDEWVVRNRYEHGGGRMYRETHSTRSLILDVYEEGDREFYFHAADFVRDLLSYVSVLEAEREGQQQQARGQALRDALDAIQGEHLCDPAPNDSGDQAYEQAIRDAFDAVQKLLPSSPLDGRAGTGSTKT